MVKFKRIHNIHSTTAAINGINNYPGVDINEDCSLTSDFIWSNLSLVHQHCIYPLCLAFGDSIRITSAYRCLALNKHLGGIPNSQHVKGYAIDLVSTEHPSSMLFNWCYQNLPAYHQLIWEHPERPNFTGIDTHPYPNMPNTQFSWIHISYIQDDNPKTSSLSSKKNDLHEMYETENTVKIGKYTHGIVFADENLL